MARRKMEDHNVRNLQKNNRSYFVRIPIELVRKFGWQEHQRLVVEEHKNGQLLIKDWDED